MLLVLAWPGMPLRQVMCCTNHLHPMMTGEGCLVSMTRHQKHPASTIVCAAVASKMRDALVTIKKSSPGNDAGVTTCFQVGTASFHPTLQAGSATISIACSPLRAVACLAV